MKRLRTLRVLTCVTLLATAPGLARASDDDHGHEDSDLEASMEKIADAFKPLYRGLLGGPDSDRVEEYLALTRTIKEEAVTSREHAPGMTAEMSEADRAAMIKDYTADMDAFIKKVEALEKALVAGNLTQAQALAKDLKSARNDGHEKYQEEED